MDLFTRLFGGLSHAVVVVLIKIRLLVDLRALHQSVIVLRSFLGSSLTMSMTSLILSRVKTSARRSKRSNLKSMNFVDTSRKPTSTSGQHCLILDVIDRETTYDSRGDEREMQLYLVYSYDAWKETSGAIDVIREKTSNKL
ncbi:hypothetical protein D6C89_01124 [Aureobasidium pullulans]|nr:hypothetical protein D6C89_01124 [Aureobasidium pullulans]